MSAVVVRNEIMGQMALPSRSATALRLRGMTVAAVTSVGAGAVHAGAIGLHAEHQGLARLFIAASVFQLGWGLIALLRPQRWLAAVGALGNAAIVGGWLVTRLSGVDFIGGLETREAAQFTDTAAASLGSVAALAAFAAVSAGWQAARPANLTVPSLMVLAITVPAMIAGANHVHSEGTEAAGHAHGTEVAAAAAAVTADGIATTVIDESQPHAHDDDGGAAAAAEEGPTHGADEASATAQASSEATAEHTAEHAAEHDAEVVAAATDDATATTLPIHVSAVVAPVPYDPTKPIDLGGVPGVTPEQQARAENLVAMNLVLLPQWSDPAVAEAAGFQSIGDGATGLEHYVHWGWINDDISLDPDFPESLVYQPQADGSKKLMSAMYMMPDTTPLSDVPDIGGALTQWHIHNNLCYTKDPVAPKVVGVTSADGTCPSNLQKMGEAPMIHVWIQPHKCGPFAALEGVGAGQIEEGEERLCDEAHGAAGH